jgi:hypothetical protein
VADGVEAEAGAEVEVDAVADVGVGHSTHRVLVAVAVALNGGEGVRTYPQHNRTADAYVAAVHSAGAWT